MNSDSSANRDYATISPSAKVLLLMKGHTGIPFAREAARLISLPDHFVPDFERKDFGYWARVVHFESRYQQVNALLDDIHPSHILELSSGFSFRGLQLSTEQEVHFIDTDLPDLIAAKRPLLEALQAGLPETRGKLEMQPLNALQETDFRAITDRFAPGPLTIINEGLLMYLNTEEKKQLCAIIRNILQERGGYWITADIYLKDEARFAGLQPKDELQQFLEAHRIDDNKFDSLEAAADFFRGEGFEIDREAEPDFGSTDALQYLVASAPAELLEQLQSGGRRIQATWRLKLAE